MPKRYDEAAVTGEVKTCPTPSQRKQQCIYISSFNSRATTCVSMICNAWYIPLDWRVHLWARLLLSRNHAFNSSSRRFPPSTSFYQGPRCPKSFLPSSSCCRCHGSRARASFSSIARPAPAQPGDSPSCWSCSLCMAKPLRHRLIIKTQSSLDLQLTDYITMRLSRCGGYFGRNWRHWININPSQWQPLSLWICSELRMLLGLNHGHSCVFLGPAVSDSTANISGSHRPVGPSQQSKSTTKLFYNSAIQKGMPFYAHMFNDLY